MRRSDSSGASSSSATSTTSSVSMTAKSPLLGGAARPVDALFSNGYHPQDHQSEKEKAWSEDAGVMVENNTPSMMLKCSDCGICKNNSEDMEIHIKMEHLNWLPFQCPVCSCQRASDAQMREHLHSSHRSSTTLFHYVDNVAAKRRLQKLLDDSLIHAIGRKQRRANGGAGTASSCSNFQTVTPEDLMQAAASDDSASGTPQGSSPLHQSATVSIMNGRKRNSSQMISSSNTDALLANINAATAAGNSIGDSDESMTTFPIASDPILDAFFAKRIKSEYDVDEENVMNGGVGVLDSSSVLDDVAALFTGDGRIDDLGDDSPAAKYLLSKATSTLKAAMAAATMNGNGAGSSNSGRSTNTPSKKRVLGECSKCQKPVTAGARQMHMFFHLGKDYNVYRFRCKYAGCTVEHYRKDQMENHHSKQHGKIDADMMEDRSLELFQRCQELSMELLGTNGSTPGPTAARALVSYNGKQESSSSSSLPKVFRRNGSSSSSMSSVSAAIASLGAGGRNAIKLEGLI